MLQIMASLSNNSRGIIYDCYIFIIQATGSKQTFTDWQNI